ncbi:MAG: helix-turn-helix domain-containing protein, partial [Clostridia bacterium]|nr:helix-turn-helix domain-containing protein [Clostridia bacterium]
KELLLELSLSVAEVAARCGFEDESYFCRFFKKHEGISPGAFRRRSVIL